MTPFFDYPPEIRKVIYTTNAIESVNMSLRKLTKNRGSFPSDEALTKLFYLALRNISQKWSMPIRDWKAALNLSSAKSASREQASLTFPDDAAQWARVKDDGRAEAALLAWYAMGKVK